MKDIGVDVLVKDKSGNNLLDPTTVGYYNHDEVKLFDIENGVRTPVINTSGISRFLIVTGDNNTTVLRLFPRDGAPKGETVRTNSIQWRANDEDVIESTLTSDHNSSHCSKVKCNGTVKYDGHDAAARRVIEIIK